MRIFREMKGETFITLAFLFFTLPSFATPSVHHPEADLKEIRAHGNAGEKIYQSYCASCHATTPIIPLGAPRIHNKDDWSSRMKNGNEQLFKNTNQGLRNMPPRGGCFECTDSEIQQAIEYLLPVKSK